MTHRERILSALRGQPVDCLPWVPRLDLWYNANRHAGTLPVAWREASLMEIVAELGVGFHAVIPDFLDTEEPDEAFDRALGVDHVKNQPYRLRFNKVRRVVERGEGRSRVIYKLPQGELSAVLRHDEGMRRAGATLMHIEEPIVKSLDDYPLVAALFEDFVVEPDQTRYRQFREQVGDAGVVVAFGNVTTSPVHHLLKELVAYDRFYFDLHDHPALVAQTARRMQGYFDQVIAASAQSDAELVLFGANYDLMVTPPPFFEPHIAPGLRQAADALHAAGKLLVTHPDGENDQLNRFYVECGVDVADSVCPAPMTRLTLADYRRDFGVRPAIWGGLCSVCVLEQSMTQAQFEAHVEQGIAAVGEGRGIVFSLADTTPPGASLERIRWIGDRLRK